MCDIFLCFKYMCGIKSPMCSCPFFFFSSLSRLCLRKTVRAFQRQTERERTLLIPQRKMFQIVSTHQTINTNLSQITATSSVFSNRDILDKLPFVCLPLSACLVWVWELDVPSCWNVLLQQKDGTLRSDQDTTDRFRGVKKKGCKSYVMKSTCVRAYMPVLWRTSAGSEKR